MIRLLQSTKLPRLKFQHYQVEMYSGTQCYSLCNSCNRRFVYPAREGIRCFYKSSYLTNVNTNLLAVAKRRKKSKGGQLTEILEVSNRDTKNKLALIKKLTAKSFAKVTSNTVKTDSKHFHNESGCPHRSLSLRCYDPIISLPRTELCRFVGDYISVEKPIEPPLSDISGEIKTKDEFFQTHSKKFQNLKIWKKKKIIKRLVPKLSKKIVISNTNLTDIVESSKFNFQNDIKMEEHVTEETCLENEVPELENLEVTESKKKSNKIKGYKTTMYLNQDIREKVAKQKLSDLQSLSKEECFNKNMLAYVDVCVNSNMMNTAYNCVKYYSRSKDNSNVIKNIEIFNTLLSGYSARGLWVKLSEVLSILKNTTLSWNLTTFVCIFECISRNNEVRYSESIIRNYTDKLLQQGFSFQDLFNKTKLVRDQHELILKTIRSVDPQFTPEVIKIDTRYDCELLNKLNKPSIFFSPIEAGLTSEDLKQLGRDQLKTELIGYAKIKTIEKRDESNDNILYFREKLEETQNQWRKTIADALERDIKILKLHSTSPVNFSLYPFLMALSREEYVEILMHEIRKLAEGSETYSPMTVLLFKLLGEQVCIRYHVNCKKNKQLLSKLEVVYDEYCDWFANPSDNFSNTRQKWQSLLQKYPQGHSLSCKDTMWPNPVLISIGRFLYNIIIRDIKIDVNITRMNSSQPHHLPAFYTLFRNQGRIVKEEIKPHPVLSRLFRYASPDELVFNTSFVPMLCPPLPWSNLNSGGYLITKTQLIRLPNQAVQQWDQMENTSPQQLYPSLDSLNQLGGIPWRVNESILDLLLQVFNSGGSSKLEVPEPPSSYVIPDNGSNNNSFRIRLAVRRRKAEMYSLWCDTLYRLSLANHFRGRTFWLPHNMDFRGRTYPCPPHLNHLGSDMARSLLVFAKCEPLGENGLDWLKIHLINLTGTMKRHSMRERLEYANEILPEILDSAEHPLTGRMWWSKSDEPWQTLAACIEVKKAIDSGDPVCYKTGFPVHQDGSCNGLQHYAALGRDEAGGESVNLTPADKPQDVYSCVVQIVERERKKDAAKGVAIAQQLDGFVSRKVIKQTIMTTVYGVTRYGARLQIARQLKDLDEFPKSFVWHGSQYLVSRTFESLQEMFTSTKQIQDWFTECARLISQVCGQNVEWITPLGLPIVQPYFRPLKSFKLSKRLDQIGGEYPMDQFERPNVMKQKNAFPPNFIHSLDSSHMMLTSLFCERAGITFVSVHDCFWTHPSSVEIMNKICRQQFVALHNEPLLQDLSDYFVYKYGYDESDLLNDDSIITAAKKRLNKILKQVPKTGQLKLKDVLKSPYFFS